MNPNLDKIDGSVLALLYLTSFTEGKEPFHVTRGWTNHDWDALDRLYEKGLTGDPKSKSASLYYSQIKAGRRRKNCLRGCSVTDVWWRNPSTNRPL
jgi:Domain of unknown function (DUF6429)